MCIYDAVFCVYCMTTWFNVNQALKDSNHMGKSSFASHTYIIRMKATRVYFKSVVVVTDAPKLIQCLQTEDRRLFAQYLISIGTHGLIVSFTVKQTLHKTYY